MCQTQAKQLVNCNLSWKQYPLVHHHHVVGRPLDHPVDPLDYYHVVVPPPFPAEVVTIIVIVFVVIIIIIIITFERRRRQRRRRS